MSRFIKSIQQLRKGGRKGAPVGFTLVETIVTLGVACILMVAVVAFLVNGMVSATKTTAINDNTIKGRYVFEHLSKEMEKSADLNLPNFILPNPASPTGTSKPTYAGFQYRVTIGGPGTNTTDLTLANTNPQLTLSFPPPTAVENRGAPFYSQPMPGITSCFPIPRAWRTLAQ